jgi:DNA-directed RNA polymerase specialized sigma24 family protein
LNTWINILAKHHNEWVTIVKSFGEQNYCEDIVQEMYLRFYNSNSAEKCITNNEPNRAYIWISLKNIYLTYSKLKSKYQKVSIEDIKELMYLEDDVEKDETWEIIKNRIQIEVNTWHLYDQQLWQVHVKENKSMRDISNGANISLSSIFNSLKNCKERIRIAVGEDYEDYLNEDYDKI